MTAFSHSINFHITSGMNGMEEKSKGKKKKIGGWKIAKWETCNAYIKIHEKLLWYARFMSFRRTIFHWKLFKGNNLIQWIDRHFYVFAHFVVDLKEDFFFGDAVLIFMVLMENMGDKFGKYAVTLQLFWIYFMKEILKEMVFQVFV